MYRCKDCGGFFEEPLYRKEYGPRDADALFGYELYSHCPYCGSEDIEEADECRSCGEYIPQGQTVCENCREDILQGMLEMADDMKMTFDDFQMAVEEVFCG